MNVDGAVGGLVRPVDPAFELAAIKRAIAWAKHAEALRNSFGFVHGGSHDDFEDGAGRQLRLNRAVQQRLLGIFV